MTKKLTKEEFKCAAALVHSDTYDYSCTNYVNAKTKIEIICHEHGAFWQVASKHLIGQGCKKCGQARSNKHNTKSHEDFVTAALAAHGDKYSYSMSIYNGSHSLINIECRKHGVFSQIAGKHLAGQGCPLCNNEDRSLNMRGDLDKFVADSKEVHGERYKYHLSEFVNDKTPVSIICDKHGVFNQTPSAHKKGKGCPECAVSGYKSDLQGFLYVLTSGNILKVGITNRQGNTRIHEISTGAKRKFKIAFKLAFEDGRIPQSIEQVVLKHLRANYKPTDGKFNGSSECFIDVDYDAVMRIISGEVELQAA